MDSSELATIQTVGVVAFSTDLPEISIAEIQFGLDTSYGQVAPVALDASGYETLLLGMKQNSTYNYRIAVSDGDSVCYGENQTIQTGGLGIDGPTVSVGAGAADGFIVVASGSNALIMDKDGDLVWAQNMGQQAMTARMSWNGQYMFSREVGPFNDASGGTFRRISMDGSGLQSIDAPGGDHHDFAPIPGGIAYMGKTAIGYCDQIFTASNDLTDGQPLVDTWEIFQYFTTAEPMLDGTELCHTNRIHYSVDGDLYTVSDRNKDALAFFDGSGAPVTSVGKTPSSGWTSHIQAEGAGSDWRVQHGHHFYTDSKLLVFSNNASGGSAMLHYTITANNAALDWKYAAAGSSTTQGDVQHLPNGNFLVTASNVGTMHQIDADQNLIATYEVGGGGPGGGGPGGGGPGFGYAWFRPTLYGPPPAR